MRISNIVVKELFGNRSLEYKIELNDEPPITILHGPNGAGKTVIFKMVAGLFGATGVDPEIFMRYPFREFKVQFHNGEHIRVTREYDARKDRYLAPRVAHSEYKTPYRLDADILIRNRLDRLPRSLRNRYVHGDLSASELLTLLPDDVFGYDVENPLSENMFIFEKFPRKRSEEPPAWLRELPSALDVQIVSTDRLFVRRAESERHSSRHRPENTSTRAAVVENSRDLERRINGVIRNANTQENTLNSAFPSRVVKSVNDGNRESWSFETVQPKLEQLKEERGRLVDVGLIDPGEELQVDRYDDKTLGSVLKIYIEDSQKKYGEYKELADKITLYKTMVEELMKDKELLVSKDKDEDRGGYTFINRNNKREIPLRELSSGEQHIIVLMYNLLFRSSREVDELILIDEPEISLHIAWQKQFVNYLEKIAELSPFDVMIATHSPHVVNARWDLEVPLVGLHT
ncbi:MAG: AAA family ATPase [Chloroflexota bacterium]|nr:AAA family ATPase [Chloroflexota bacterium]MDE2911292.1 AAA family ATPase [Chloroflexota bacterium]